MRLRYCSLPPTLPLGSLMKVTTASEKTLSGVPKRTRSRGTAPLRTLATCDPELQLVRDSVLAISAKAATGMDLTFSMGDLLFQCRAAHWAACLSSLTVTNGRQ